MKKIFLCLMVMGLTVLTDSYSKTYPPTSSQQGKQVCMNFYNGPGYPGADGTFICPTDDSVLCHTVCWKVKSFMTDIVDVNERVHLWVNTPDKFVGYANMLVVEKTDISSGETKNFKIDEYTKQVDSFEELLKIDFIEIKGDN